MAPSPSPSPSPSAADDLPFLQNQIEDNNVKPFSILHKATVPQKRSARTRIGSSSASSPNVTDNCDDDLHDKLRMEAFRSVWSKIETTIKEVLRNINGGAFSKIDQWIHESFTAIRSCGVPTSSKTTCSYPIATDVTANKLFTGLVLTKNMEFVDDLQTFSDLRLHLKARGCHVASLSSLDFSAKNGIGLCLKSLFRQFLTFNADAADLSVLASWYNELGSNKHPVVVIIDDIDRCSGSVLSDFILILSEWVVKLPIILLIGVATTCDAPRNILSSDALLHLSICKFTLGSPADRLDAIIEAVLVKQCSGFTVGHNVSNFLRNCFMKHDGTLSSLTRALKVAIVQHFIMQPLSFMSRVFLDEEGSQVAVLSEAWSKQAFDLPSCRRIKCAEPKGEIWSRSLSQMKRIQNLWSSVVLCLYEAGKNTKTTLLDLYNEALDPELYDSRASDHSSAVECDMPMPPEDQFIHRQHIKMWKGGSISQMTRQVRDLSAAALCQLLERWEKLTDEVNEIHEKVKQLQSSIKFEGEKSWKRELPDASKTRVSSGLRIEKGVKASNEKAVALLHCMMRDYMQPIECLSFHEIVCFKNVHKLQSALMGDPRRRIQVDLLEPHKILNCSCCRKSCNIPLPSMHDTSIMYALAQEHGDLINLYDWYQSFKATIHPNNQGKHRSKQLPSPKKRKITSVRPSETEASVQARFCRAVTELQITGLLRMPSKRRPDYVQRVAFGL